LQIGSEKAKKVIAEFYNHAFAKDFLPDQFPGNLFFFLQEEFHSLRKRKVLTCQIKFKIGGKASLTPPFCRTSCREYAQLLPEWLKTWSMGDGVPDNA